MTESILAQIGRASRRSVLGALAVAILLGTGGCSWYEGTRDWIVGDDNAEAAEQPEAKPVPGADEPYPALTSVPERPSRTTATEDRQVAQSLTADREAARYTDEQIRRQSAEAVAGATAVEASAPSPSGENGDAPVADTPLADEPAPAPRQASAAPAEPSPAPKPSQAPVQNAPEPAPRPEAATPVPREPVEVQSLQPAAGQTAAVPTGPGQAMSSAPPPAPDIPAVVTRNQPIPVTPEPAQQPYRVPAPPPEEVQVAPTEQQTTFFRPNRFAPRYGAGAGPASTRRTFGPPPTGAPASTPRFTQGRSSGGTPAPEVPAAPGFSSGGPPVATVYFGAGSTAVGPRGREAIREAFRLWQSRGGSIRVVGHASSRTRNMDRVSHELANFRVSDERARAVARELVRLGVDPTAIIVEAVSDQQPAYLEVMPAGEAGNRRAEILLEN